MRTLVVSYSSHLLLRLLLTVDGREPRAIEQMLGSLTIPFKFSDGTASSSPVFQRTQDAARVSCIDEFPLVYFNHLPHSTKGSRLS